jgi:hypothetical protein
MTTKILLSASAAALALCALGGCAPPPKVLVASDFNGDDKTSKMLIQDSGQVDPSSKKKLFNVYVRMCGIDARAVESACKDTLVVENVVPGSVY